jgi:hypothetical protein
MYVSLSSLFEYERERCPFRANGGFTDSSAAWRHYSTFIFVDETVCAADYLDMLQEFVLQQDGVLDTIIFKHDGAPPHWALIVWLCIDDTCNNHWCGRDGPIPWPANSPDLTPPGFFVWGYVKTLVYGQRPQNEADLRQITAAFLQIIQEMPRTTCCNLSMQHE